MRFCQLSIPTGKSAMAALRLDHLTLLVSSFDKSIRWYDALLPLLGFAKDTTGICQNGAGLWLQFREAEPETRPYERYGPGMNHVGFAAPSPEFVAGVRSAMTEAGFEVADLQRLGPATALFLKDPDGIRFEVTHYPEGTPPVS